MPGPASATVEPRAAVHAARAGPRRASRRRVRADVREQVVDDLAQPVAIAEHGRPGRARRRSAARDRPCAPSRPPRRRPRRAATGSCSSGRPSSRRASSSRSSTSTAHALRLAADPAHRAREVVGPVGGAAREELGVGAHRGERRSQLVRRVGDEAAELPLGGLDARSGTPASIWPSIALSARPSRPTSVRSSARSTRLRQVAGRDRGRGRADRVERPQARAARPRARARRWRRARAPSRAARSGAGGAACCRRRAAARDESM